MSTKPVPRDFGLGADGRLAISPAEFLAAHKPAPRPRPGLGDLVSKIATPIARALNWDCIDPATKDLKPDSGCAGRRDALNALTLDADNIPRFDLHGGLGDVFMDLFERPVYDWLGAMKAEDRARVVFWCSNPFAPELFQWHPKREQIEVLACQNWNGSHHDTACAKALGIKPPRMNRSLVPRAPEGGLPLEFYPSPADLVVLEEIRIAAADRPIIVLAPGAGEAVRNIPRAMLGEIVSGVIVAGFFPVQIGRHYPRGSRHEPPHAAWAHDVIGRLSVPGTARLAQISAGMVTCHSAMNILAWFLRKPQLLLYPDPVGSAFFRRTTRWSFGADFPETTHCPFSAFCPHHFESFLASMKT